MAWMGYIRPGQFCLSRKSTDPHWSLVSNEIVSGVRDLEKRETAGNDWNSVHDS